MTLFFLIFIIAPCAGLLLFVGVRKNLNYTILAIFGVQLTIIGGLVCLLIHGAYGIIAGAIIIFTGLLLSLTSLIATSGEN